MFILISVLSVSWFFTGFALIAWVLYTLIKDIELLVKDKHQTFKNLKL